MEMTRKSRIRIAFVKRRVGQADQLRTVCADPVGWRRENVLVGRRRWRRRFRNASAADAVWRNARSRRLFNKTSWSDQSILIVMLARSFIRMILKKKWTMAIARATGGAAGINRPGQCHHVPRHAPLLHDDILTGAKFRLQTG
jgi:hypothetical protein